MHLLNFYCKFVVHKLMSNKFSITRSQKNKMLKNIANLSFEFQNLCTYYHLNYRSYININFVFGNYSKCNSSFSSFCFCANAELHSHMCRVLQKYGKIHGVIEMTDTELQDTRKFVESVFFWLELNIWRNSKKYTFFFAQLKANFAHFGDFNWNQNLIWEFFCLL